MGVDQAIIKLGDVKLGYNSVFPNPSLSNSEHCAVYIHLAGSSTAAI